MVKKQDKCITDFKNSTCPACKNPHQGNNTSGMFMPCTNFLCLGINNKFTMNILGQTKKALCFRLHVEK